VLAAAAQRHARGVDRLDAGHRVPFDARDLDQAADRVAGEAEVVLHRDLGGVLDLARRSSHHFGQAARGHRAGRADLALAAHLGAADAGVLLVEDADRAGGEQEALDPGVVGVRHEARVVVQHRRDDPGRTVGRRCDDPAARGVLFVDRERVQVHPVHRGERVAQARLGVGDQHLVHLRRAPRHLESAGQDALVLDPALDAVLHHLPDPQQALGDLFVAAPGLLVLAHDLAHGNRMGCAVLEQLFGCCERVLERGGVRLDRAPGGDALVDDETAADGVIDAAADLLSARVERREAQPVRVEGQALPLEQQVLGGLEVDVLLLEQLQPSGFLDPLDELRDSLDLDAFGRLAQQAEDDGLVAAVAPPRSAEAAEQLGADRLRSLDELRVVQILSEHPPGSHRSDRMRAARADSDLEELEDADRHRRGGLRPGA
jgi:hypothetical protein